MYFPLQAIGDPGQGWGNAILYIFMSPVMRERLFCKPCKRSIRRIGRALSMFAPSSDTEVQLSASAEAGQDVHMSRGDERPLAV